jgi:hypothetical protein
VARPELTPVFRPERERAAAPRRAVVLGGADCVWNDIAELVNYDPAWPDVVIAVNNVGYAYPGVIHHWVSLHPDKLRREWEPLRPGPAAYQDWTDRFPQPGMRRVTPWSAGSSGLLGVTVAVDMLGCSEVVVCGIPLDTRPHFDDDQAWTDALKHQHAWRRRLELMIGRVRSMSGWTAELLGRPPFLESRDNSWAGAAAEVYSGHE